MKTYKLNICRTVKVVTDIYIIGDSPEDAAARFEHQLESDQCSELENQPWSELFTYAIEKQGPYEGDYEVVGINEEEEFND